ncbi:hypothetical protein [Kribbella sp. VKM Ac-2568]|uniref:hypothetical protein n=1 Tax=Kribbella sp. VKM Ac-2568 TaxID=2512219 RepID=UPI001047DF91|nr:hypothetical protein [Kribbella sp. VKM Ac-2568]
MTTTRRRPLIGGLLVSTMAVGLLAAGGTPAAAQTTEHVSAQASRPPALGKARVTCYPAEGAGVVAKLRNPNKTTKDYMVPITGGDTHYDYVVTVPARSAEPIEFGGIPNGKYLLRVQNDVGDFVAQAKVRVNCSNHCHAGGPT